MIVDLPAPLLPTKAVVLLAGIVIDTSSKMACPGQDRKLNNTLSNKISPVIDLCLIGCLIASGIEEGGSGICGIQSNKKNTRPPAPSPSKIFAILVAIWPIANPILMMYELNAVNEPNFHRMQ